MSDTLITRDEFKNASTFSYIGRHAIELRFLLSTLQQPPKKILEIGPGPFEPFYLSQMLPDASEIIAVDANTDVYNTLTRLIAGELVSLESLARISCNKRNDGTPDLNTDLTDEAILRIGLGELKTANINPNTVLTDRTYHRAEDGARIIPVKSDIITYARDHPNEFDFVYAGVVLLNIGKDIDSKSMQQFTLTIVDTLKNDGVLGIGTTPAGLYGEKSELRMLNGANATVTDVVVDNLVNANGILRGGYSIRAVNNPNAQSSIKLDSLDSLISQDDILGKLTPVITVKTKEEFFEYVSKSGEENDKLILTALKKGSDYMVFEVLKNQLKEVVPEKRKVLSLLYESTKQ